MYFQDRVLSNYGSEELAEWEQDKQRCTAGLYSVHSQGDSGVYAASSRAVGETRKDDNTAELACQREAVENVSPEAQGDSGACAASSRTVGETPERGNDLDEIPGATEVGNYGWNIPIEIPGSTKVGHYGWCVDNEIQKAKTAF